MARLPPQPLSLVILNRSIRLSTISINPVPARPPTKAKKKSSMGLPLLTILFLDALRGRSKGEYQAALNSKLT